MVKVEINEFKVSRILMGKRIVELSFGFLQNGLQKKITKEFNINDDSVSFILKTMADIKKATEMPIAQVDKEEQMKEKLVNSLNRLKKEMDELTKIKESEKYMKQYNKVNSYKINFPEFVR